MHAHQIQTVRSSFNLLQPIATHAAELFYTHLFAADPLLRQLFRGDMAQQGERLMTMIGAAVGLLDRPDALIPVLQKLGARHAGYGVVEAHYATVGDALCQHSNRVLAMPLRPRLVQLGPSCMVLSAAR